MQIIGPVLILTFPNSARRFARGYEKIINSPLKLPHECGLNPNVSCDTIPPDDMNIEGSH